MADERGVEVQPRRGVLEHGGKPGGETGLSAVGISDRKGQRFGIAQPDAAAPHRCNRQNQSQCGKQQHLSAIACNNARAGGPKASVGLQHSWLIPVFRAIGRHAGAEGRPNESVNI
jgi:hypothetical protein